MLRHGSLRKNGSFNTTLVKVLLLEKELLYMAGFSFNTTLVKVLFGTIPCARIKQLRFNTTLVKVLFVCWF